LHQTQGLICLFYWKIRLNLETIPIPLSWKTMRGAGRSQKISR